jgi:hypothetical protein|eukprot:COSAG01_NODE_24583_length_773_cov_114.310089_2_plen_69_part_01
MDAVCRPLVVAEQLTLGGRHTVRVTAEQVIWPHLAEISLLGAIGCGGWLMRLILEELEAPDSKYHLCPP